MIVMKGWFSSLFKKLLKFGFQFFFRVWFFRCSEWTGCCSWKKNRLFIRNEILEFNEGKGMKVLMKWNEKKINEKYFLNKNKNRNNIIISGRNRAFSPTKNETRVLREQNIIRFFRRFRTINRADGKENFAGRNFAT